MLKLLGSAAVGSEPPCGFLKILGSIEEAILRPNKSMQERICADFHGLHL
jgi:hypothetical protein